MLRARASDRESTFFLKREGLGNQALGPEATLQTHVVRLRKGCFRELILQSTLRCQTTDASLLAVTSMVGVILFI